MYRKLNKVVNKVTKHACVTKTRSAGCVNPHLVFWCSPIKRHIGGGIFCFGSFAVFVMAYAVVMAMPFLNSL